MEEDCAEGGFEMGGSIGEEEDLEDGWGTSESGEGRRAEGGSGEMEEEGQGHNA